MVVILHPICMSIVRRHCGVCGNWNQGNSEDEEEDFEDRRSVVCK